MQVYDDSGGVLVVDGDKSLSHTNLYLFVLRTYANALVLPASMYQRPIVLV